MEAIFKTGMVEFTGWNRGAGKVGKQGNHANSITAWVLGTVFITASLAIIKCFVHEDFSKRILHTV